MEQYCYQFAWRTRVEYIYAASLVDAKKDFQETFKVDPESPNVVITRQEPGFSRITNPFNN